MWLDEGWIEEDWVHRLQSPNQDARPMGTVVDTLVNHCPVFEATRLSCARFIWRVDWPACFFTFSD